MHRGSPSYVRVYSGIPGCSLPLPGMNAGRSGCAREGPDVTGSARTGVCGYPCARHCQASSRAGAPALGTPLWGARGLGTGSPQNSYTFDRNRTCALSAVDLSAFFYLVSLGDCRPPDLPDWGAAAPQPPRGVVARWSMQTAGGASKDGAAMGQNDHGLGAVQCTLKRDSLPTVLG